MRLGFNQEHQLKQFKAYKKIDSVSLIISSQKQLFLQKSSHFDCIAHVDRLIHFSVKFVLKHYTV